MGYITASSEGCTLLLPGRTKSEVVRKWAEWLHNLCRQGGPQPGPNASERGTKSQVAHKWADWLHNPCHLGDFYRFREGVKTSLGPQGGGLAS